MAGKQRCEMYVSSNRASAACPFSEDEKFSIHPLCLQGSSVGRPKKKKNAKIKQHAEYSSVNFGAIFAPLCSCDTLLK